MGDVRERDEDAREEETEAVFRFRLFLPPLPSPRPFVAPYSFVRQCARVPAD